MRRFLAVMAAAAASCALATVASAADPKPRPTPGATGGKPVFGQPGFGQPTPAPNNNPNNAGDTGGPNSGPNSVPSNGPPPGGPGQRKGNFAFGKISALTDTTLTFANRDGSTASFTVGANTKLNGFGKDATLASLKVGDTVGVKAGKNGNALEVFNGDRRRGPGNGGPPPGPPGQGPDGPPPGDNNGPPPGPPPGDNNGPPPPPNGNGPGGGPGQGGAQAARGK